MTKTIEFFYDYGSPTSYLAAMQLPALAKRMGAEIAYRPILLGGVFKASGNSTPVAIPAKAKYMFMDMQRTAKRLGIPFVMNPFFIINTLALMRGAVAAREDGCFPPYDAAMWRAMWVEGKNMGDPAVVGEVLVAAGLDPKWFEARTADPVIKQKLVEATNEAVERGAFGAPTFFVGDEMAFGSDRLDDVERALAG